MEWRSEEQRKGETDERSERDRRGNRILEVKWLFGGLSRLHHREDGGAEEEQ